MEAQIHAKEPVAALHQDASFMSYQNQMHSMNANPGHTNEQQEADHIPGQGIQDEYMHDQGIHEPNYTNNNTPHPNSSGNFSAGHNGGFHYVSCEPAPMVEMKLFCGRVPKTMNEDDIERVFQEFGNVKEVIIIRDKESNNHKSSAFVKMASIAHADAAIHALNGHKTLDSAMGPLQVKYANGEAAKHNLLDSTATEPGAHQAKVFVGSLPKSSTEEMVRDLFSPYGVVDEVFIMMDKASGIGKGCAFVKFAFKEQAMYAMKMLDGKRTLDGCTRPIEVRFAETKAQKPASNFNQFPVPPHVGNPYSPLPIIHPTAPPPLPPAPAPPRAIGHWKEYVTSDGRFYYHNEQTQSTTWDKPHEFDQMMNSSSLATGAFGKDQSSTGPKGANIFVFYVPNEWTQNELINAFSSFGTIISARIATDKQSGRNRGYAFVSYDSAQAAAAAVHHMNGYLANTKRLKVTIKKGEESFVQPILDQLANSSTGGGGSEQMRNNPPVFPMGGQSAQFGTYGPRYTPY